MRPFEVRSPTRLLLLGIDPGRKRQVDDFFVGLPQNAVLDIAALSEAIWVRNIGVRERDHLPAVVDRSRRKHVHAFGTAKSAEVNEPTTRVRDLAELPARALGRVPARTIPSRGKEEAY